MVIPSEREADIAGILLAAHMRLALEETSELFTEEELEPPPFDLVALGLINDTDVTPDSDGRVMRRAAARHGQRHRVKRVVENLEPVQCSE